LIPWLSDKSGWWWMALGRQRERQSDMLVSWSDLPRSPGHIFYDKLQAVLIAADFDRFVERQCATEYAPRRGRPSLPPGRYFRMLLIGYFEGIDSERGLEWRCADSLSLREFLRLSERERVPDHSWLSRTRSRLPLEIPDQVFTWVLNRLAEHGLIKGEHIGVHASTIEANAALRTIVRRDSGKGYREMLTRMARESGIETPTAQELVRLDRHCKGKKLSNADWDSATDRDAKIAKLKDGRTHLTYKPEHAMDLDTGAVVAAELHPADQGDTTTMPGTLASAAEHLAAVNAAPTPTAPAELIADTGYHSRARLKELDGGPWKSRISEPHRDAFSRWHGDDAARRAVYNNRARRLSGVARQAFRLRAELVERGFALILDRGGMRRVWLRGRENVQKPYLIHVAGYNMGLVMRLLTGAGTPREFRVRACVWLFATWEPDAGLIIMFAVTGDQSAALTINIRPDTLG
jgi:transposase